MALWYLLIEVENNASLASTRVVKMDVWMALMYRCSSEKQR